MSFWVTTTLYGDDGVPGEVDTQYDDDSSYKIEDSGVLAIYTATRRTRISPTHWIKVVEAVDPDEPAAFFL